VADGDLPVLARDQERLDLFDRVPPRGGVARVADRRSSHQSVQHILGQNIGDQPLRPVLIEVAAVAGHNAARLLAAVLLRKKPKLRQRRGLRMAEDTENAAFFVKFVENQVHQ
jgi:hypothetical protein